jgi:uncharacterized protein
LVAEGFVLAVTNEILSGHAGVVARKTSGEVAQNVGRLLLALPNLLLIQVYYHWRLIPADPDDDKFVDCAVAAQADYLVSNDKHFSVLAGVPFPKVRVLGGEEFLALLGQLPTAPS